MNHRLIVHRADDDDFLDVTVVTAPLPSDYRRIEREDHQGRRPLTVCFCGKATSGYAICGECGYGSRGAREARALVGDIEDFLIDAALEASLEQNPAWVAAAAEVIDKRPRS